MSEIDLNKKQIPVFPIDNTSANATQQEGD